MDAANCIVETYKNKRSVYFAVSNLLPSDVLMREYNKEYHLLLIGVDEGELIHKDFGVFHVNSAGEGSLFKEKILSQPCSLPSQSSIGASVLTSAAG